jgi:hypothetical protein
MAGHLGPWPENHNGQEKCGGCGIAGGLVASKFIFLHDRSLPPSARLIAIVHTPITSRAIANGEVSPLVIFIRELKYID